MTDDRRQRTDGGRRRTDDRRERREGRRTTAWQFSYSLPDARYWFGIIARWTGEGTVFPFSIGRVDRAQLEKPGTVMEAFVVG